MKKIACFAAVLILGSGCNREAESVAPPPSPTKPTKLVRPPFPNMANALWGRALVKDLPQNEKVSQGHLAQWQKLWHENVAADAEELKRQARLFYREAKLPAQKNTALSLLAVSHCLDWSSPSYKDRLVDAVGLISLAGEGGEETLFGQVARSFVMAKAGLVHQSGQIIQFLKTEKDNTANVHLMKAMTLDVLRQYNDNFVRHLNKTVEKKANSQRARWMKGKLLNRWGAHKMALQTLSPENDPSFRLRLEQGRAHFGLGEYQKAQKVVTLSEDQRASLAPTELGQLNDLEAQIALARKDRALFENRIAQLALSPYFKAEEKLLRTLAQPQLKSLVEQDLPRVNRMPAHLRLATVKLWLRWCLATENKKVFKEAAQKGHELGMDAGEIYLMDAELKQRLSRSRSAPQEKTALQKESQYLKEEARKVWPKGLNAKTGQWVLAVRRAIVDGAKVWARKLMEEKGKRFLQDPVLRALMAQTQETPEGAWAESIKALGAQNQLATVDVKTLLGLAPKTLSREDKIELELISQKSTNPAVKSLIAARLNVREDHHDHDHGHEAE